MGDLEQQKPVFTAPWPMFCCPEMKGTVEDGPLTLSWDARHNWYMCPKCFQVWSPVMETVKQTDKRSLVVASWLADFRVTKMAPIMGVTRHAVRRRLEKHGLLVSFKAMNKWLREGGKRPKDEIQQGGDKRSETG